PGRIDRVPEIILAEIDEDPVEAVDDPGMHRSAEGSRSEVEEQAHIALDWREAHWRTETRPDVGRVARATCRRNVSRLRRNAVGKSAVVPADPSAIGLTGL